MKAQGDLSLVARMSKTFRWASMTAPVVGVPPRTGPAHLEKLVGHVRSREVLGLQVGKEHPVNLGRRLLRLGDRLEPPMWEDFALVWFDQQPALLALTDPVQVRALAEVGRLEVQGVVEPGRAGLHVFLSASKRLSSAASTGLTRW